jgi:hypothetical protein
MRLSNGNFSISKKWRYILDTDLMVSDKCCYHLKKAPLKKLKLNYMTGERITESNLRRRRYHTCILPNKCIPLRLWSDEMCDWYIKKNNLELSEIYTKHHYSRTGCFACMYGCHLEKYPNRFQTMKETHPKLYDFCLNYLNLKKSLDIMKINY